MDNESNESDPMNEPVGGVPEEASAVEDLYAGDEFEAPPPVEPPREDSWMGNKWVVMSGRVIAGVVILIATLCIHWSGMPELFDVEERALERARASEYFEEDFEGRLPTGYTTVSTIMELGEWLLEKPGGYLYNDRLVPPAYIIDNMPNFEYGVVVQLQDSVRSLRFGFSRSRAQSEERPELIVAHQRFAFDHDSWLIPSSESQYREGLKHLQKYLDAIAQSGSDARLFIARQDNLETWLKEQQQRLGGFGVRLRANAGVYEYNPFLYRSDEEFFGGVGASFDFENQEKTHWRRRDDVFYEVRGSLYVLYHVMMAIRTDYEKVLNDYEAMGIMNRIVSELHAASQPMVSPVVLNGAEYGFFHNHSLTLAAHTAKAHLAIQDLRILLRGGGDF